MTGIHNAKEFDIYRTLTTQYQTENYIFTFLTQFKAVKNQMNGNINGSKEKIYSFNFSSKVIEIS